MTAATVVAESLRSRRHRRGGIAAATVYVLLYLLAIGDLSVSLGGGAARFASAPSLRIVPDWSSRLFEARAAFYYQPVAAVQPLEQVTLLVAPLNVAMGLLLGALVGLNVAVALHALASARACRTRAFGGLLGAVPGLLTGFACCVPTFALVLGAQSTLALVAVRSWFFPFAVAALAAALAWNTRRVPRPPEPSVAGAATASSA